MKSMIQLVAVLLITGILIGVSAGEMVFKTITLKTNSTGYAVSTENLNGKLYSVDLIDSGTFNSEVTIKITQLDPFEKEIVELPAYRGNETYYVRDRSAIDDPGYMFVFGGAVKFEVFNGDRDSTVPVYLILEK